MDGVRTGLAAMACSDPVGVPATSVTGSSCDKDIDALQTAAITSQTCSDCPVGSHCEDGRCRWECYASSDCGPGELCTCDGRCAPAPRVQALSASEDCAEPTEAELEATLASVSQSAASCSSSNDCPCGTHCGISGTCKAECSASNSSIVGTCPAQTQCTARGLCVAEDAQEPPESVLAIDFSTPMVRVRPGADAPDLAVALQIPSGALEAQAEAALVELRGAEHRPGAPALQCEAADSADSACVIDGGWRFEFSEGTLVSAPVPVKLVIPEGAQPGEWLIQARSRLARQPAAVLVVVDPILESPDDRGRYQGTVSLVGADAADQPAELPVTVALGASELAVIEPSAAVFGRPHLRWARTPGATAAVPWLASDAPSQAADEGGQLAARLELVEVETDPAAGTATARIAVDVGFERQELLLSLQRDALMSTGTCASCGSGEYCDEEFQLCLPGDGRPAVDDPSAAGSSWLTASKLLQWESALAKRGSPGLGLRAAEDALCGVSADGAAYIGLLDPATTTKALLCEDPGADLGITAFAHDGVEVWSATARTCLRCPTTAA
jgi:hypothetical protein